MLTYEERTFFHLLPGSVFGDYQTIFALQSNMIFRSHGLSLKKSVALQEEQETVKIMCVDKEIFENLCELYPKT